MNNNSTIKKINNDKLVEFEEFMNKRSDATRKVQQNISSKNTNSISINSASKSNRSLDRIRSVDPTHVPTDRRVRAKDCGGSFDLEATLRKNKQHKKYTAKQKQNLRKLALTVGLSAILLAGVRSQVKEVKEFNNLSVDTNAENGYEVNISSTTMQEIQDIEEAINLARASTTEPDYENLKSIRDNLDSTYDHIISDLVSKAFKDANPDCTLESVETKYDKTLNSSPNVEPVPENYITITYTTKDGEPKQISITDFNSIMFADNPIEDSFDKEYDLDHTYPTHYSDSSTESFEERAENTTKYLDFCETTLEQMKHLAGTEIYGTRLKDGFHLFSPKLKTVIPEKTKDNEYDER
jgi:hypothetical protein